MLGIPRVANAGEPVPEHHRVEAFLDGSRHPLPRCAVENTIEVIEVPENEREVEQLRLRREGREPAAGARGGSRQRPELHHEAGFFLGAELRVLENLNLDPAVGFALEDLFEHLETDLVRVLDTAVVSHLQDDRVAGTGAARAHQTAQECHRDGPARDPPHCMVWPPLA